MAIATCIGLETAGETVCYPFFINEAAYYEKGVAFFIAHRSSQPVHLLPAQAVSEARAAIDKKRRRPDE